ncbi:hypothetical protein G5C60_17310 [Streptomyces sp. HC44]|uniref:Uncharacterized protein n=1 Tax=Streptomyces scabichelini TaxID=2711217 RepID=A0A6G4V5Q7_9ACTN|nr:hypothetical protein [Streptomyces scabichelini]NGO09311.1 hypothetical protein [Streptomyces scabichelini]
MGQVIEITTRPRVRIEIDLNSRNDEGLVPAFIEDADGYIAVGDTVTAFESEDEVAAPAVVRKIEHGFAYLDVRWSAMIDDVPQPVPHPITPALAENRSATSSGASWVRVKVSKVVTPILATAAAVAAATTGAPIGGTATTGVANAASNSISMRDVTTAMEAGDTA